MWPFKNKIDKYKSRVDDIEAKIQFMHIYRDGCNHDDWAKNMMRQEYDRYRYLKFIKELKSQSK